MRWSCEKKCNGRMSFQIDHHRLFRQNRFMFVCLYRHAYICRQIVPCCYWYSIYWCLSQLQSVNHFAMKFSDTYVHTWAFSKSLIFLDHFNHWRKQALPMLLIDICQKERQTTSKRLESQNKHVKKKYRRSMIIGLPGFIAEEQICNYLLFKTLIFKAVWMCLSRSFMNRKTYSFRKNNLFSTIFYRLYHR